MNPIFDTIVLGIGGMGSATIAELATRGERVLGIEQFPLLHEQGSSHGHTRMIRLAYYEHPDYVPILRRAFARWHELEAKTGAKLLHQCGVLSLGSPGAELIDGVRHAKQLHDLEVDDMTPGEVMQRWPQFRVPADYVGLFEKCAGFLLVEECTRLHQQIAKQHGAKIHAEETVQNYQITPTGVTVTTDRETYHAARLVITAGAWATKLLLNLQVPLRISRQLVHWFATCDDSQFSVEQFPGYIVTTPRGEFYGFPVLDSQGAKAAQHFGSPELAFPEDVDRTVYEADSQPTGNFLKQFIPGICGPAKKSSVCMYTLSPDRHFIIDRHPEHAHVVFGTGFSGHGFKFASVMGEILSDLVLNGRSPLPIEMFEMRRFAR